MGREVRIAAREYRRPGEYPWTKRWVESQDNAMGRQQHTHYDAALSSNGTMRNAPSDLIET